MSTGSVTVMTEMSAHRGLLLLTRFRTNQTITEPIRIRMEYCRQEGWGDAGAGVSAMVVMEFLRAPWRFLEGRGHRARHGILAAFPKNGDLCAAKLRRPPNLT